MDADPYGPHPLSDQLLIPSILFWFRSKKCEKRNAANSHIFKSRKRHNFMRSFGNCKQWHKNVITSAQLQALEGQLRQFCCYQSTPASVEEYRTYWPFALSRMSFINFSIFSSLPKTRAEMTCSPLLSISSLSSLLRFASSAAASFNSL